jgi:hypothetical protein
MVLSVFWSRYGRYNPFGVARQGAASSPKANTVSGGGQQLNLSWPGVRTAKVNFVAISQPLAYLGLPDESLVSSLACARVAPCAPASLPEQFQSEIVLKNSLFLVDCKLNHLLKI